MSELFLLYLALTASLLAAAVVGVELVAGRPFVAWVFLAGSAVAGAIALFFHDQINGKP
jgi:hypothetical protein